MSGRLHVVFLLCYSYSRSAMPGNIKSWLSPRMSTVKRLACTRFLDDSKILQTARAAPSGLCRGTSTNNRQTTKGWTAARARSTNGTALADPSAPS